MVRGARCIQVSRFNPSKRPKIRREDVKPREGQNLLEVTQHLWSLHCSMPLLRSSQDRPDLRVSKGTSKASAPQGSSPSVAVVSQSSCPVLTGVPQITMWTTPQRCCGSGWLLWAVTTRLWSGSLRKRPGDLRARVLEKTESSCSSVSQSPEQAAHCPAEKENASLFASSGPTQMNRAPSTGPEKGISL